MTGPADDGARRAELRRHVLELTSDLRQWVEWAALTGAADLPVEPVPVASPLQRARAAASAPRAPRPPASQAGRAPAPPAARAPAPPAGRPGAAPAPAPSADGPPPWLLEVPPPDVGAPAGPRDDDPRVAAARHADPQPAPQPPARPPQPDETLDAIEAELGACVRCPLSQTRRHIVYGVGAPDARLVIIGEGPGRDEDLTGEPFVGRSGQLLNRMLEAIGLRREDAYICNVVKCRPPGNRDPLPLEVATCSPFLRRQVRAIGPRVILTVGRFAGQTILGTDASMGQMRRSVGSVDGTPVVATYHPSYLLRTPAMKARAWEDLLKVRRLLTAR